MRRKAEERASKKKRGREENKKAEEGEDDTIVPGQIKEGLPTITMKEVKEHASLSTGVWVVYKQGVYDITEFIRRHPGGAHRIMLAAGASIEPFWNMYAQHQNQEVYEMLEEMRIGNLAPEAPEAGAGGKGDPADPYRNEPARAEWFSVRMTKPFNAEPPLELLVDRFITPNDLYYVRNHFPVPHIDVDNYFLDIGTIDGHWVRLTLPFLQSKFTKHSITVTTECAGNRRADMTRTAGTKKIQGLSWGPAAISTATWTGVLLKDVIEFYKLTDPRNLGFTLRHIHFIGSDSADGVTYYSASVPVEKVMNDGGDVLLAFEMNGEPIPLDHGFPLRVIVPGYVGARNVKWLRTIMLTDSESTSHWQRMDYKVLPPGIDLSNVTHNDFLEARPIYELPIISAICVPQDGTVVEPGTQSLSLKGYAYSGGGREIIRVDLSPDGGKSWVQADLITSLDQEEKIYDRVHDEADPLTRAADAARGERPGWRWTLWKIDDLPLTFAASQQGDHEGQELCEILVRAVDSAYNVQPESTVWNVRGFLNNSWHSVRILRPTSSSP